MDEEKQSELIKEVVKKTIKSYKDEIEMLEDYLSKSK